MNIEDDYVAFCFDEACAYITKQLQDDREPNFIDIKKEKPKNNSEFITEFGK